MTSHIMDQLTDRRAIIRFLNALDELPPEILRMIAGRIVAKLCPGVLKVNEVNNFSSSVLRRLSFSRKLASAALHELPTVVTIEYNGPRLAGWSTTNPIQSEALRLVGCLNEV